MKKDIQNRNDIEQVVKHFNEKLKVDSELGVFFTEVIKINWEKHNELMCDFWENVLLHTGKYEGNPLKTHKRINAIKATENHHFEKWIQLFFQTVDSLYKGPLAEKMKLHSSAIAMLMKQKLE